MKNTIDIVKQETAILEDMKERIENDDAPNKDYIMNYTDSDSELAEIDEKKDEDSIEGWKKPAHAKKKTGSFICVIKKVMEDLENTRYNSIMEKGVKNFLEKIIEKNPSIIDELEEILNVIYFQENKEPEIKFCIVDQIKQLIALFRYVYTFYDMFKEPDDKNILLVCREAFKILITIFVFEFAEKIKGLNETNFDYLTELIDDVESLIRLDFILKIANGKPKPKSQNLTLLDNIRRVANHYMCKPNK